MEAFALYLLKSVIWLTGFALVYFLFLRNERFFILKRFYLISGILISVFLPFISVHYQVELPSPVANTVDFIPSDNSILKTAHGVNPVKPLDFRHIMLFLYISGILFFAFRLIKNIRLLCSTIKKATIVNLGTVKLVRASEFSTPFSFFNYVFINPSVSDTEIEVIMDHELVHVRQKHWFDLLIIELLRLLQWANPFAWIYTGFIRLNHEYIADESVLKHTTDPTIYKAALLNQMFSSQVICLSNSFNYSLNKNRFKMMKKIIFSPYRKLKVLFVLPVFTIVFYAFAIPEYHYVNTLTDPMVIYQVPPMIQKVVKGIVTKENGEPLEGVNIMSTGTTGNASVAYSGEDGRFVINNVQDDAYLHIMLRGYKSQTIKAGFKKDLIIKMVKDPDYKEPEHKTSTQAGVPQPEGLVVFDGVVTDEPPAVLMSKLGSEFGTIRRLTGKEAIDKYGDAGKSGVTEIYSVKKATELKIIPFRRKEPDDFPTFRGQRFVSFHDWVISQAKYPPDAAARGIQGRIMVNYTVEEDGSIGKTSLMGKPDQLLGEAVLKTVQSSPKWEPARNPEAYGPFENTVSIKFELPDRVLKDDVYVMAEKMPQYPGGEGELLKFLATNAKYPESAKFEKAEGRVIVRFIVNTDGNVEEAIVLKGINPYLDAEALRIVNMLKRFTTASQGGKPVSVYYMVPITFALSKTDTTN